MKKTLNRILILFVLTVPISFVNAKISNLDLYQIKDSGVVLDTMFVNSNDVKVLFKIEKGYDVKAWMIFGKDFVADKDNCQNTENRINIKGKYRKGDYFNIPINNLKQNTSYYYKICLKGKDLDYQSSTIFFVTEADDKGEVEVQTEKPYNIQGNIAILEGAVKSGFNLNTWFSVSDEKKKASCEEKSKYLSRSSSEEVENYVDLITNLKYDTKYYYSFCAQSLDEKKIYSGDIKSFKTDKQEDDKSEYYDDLDAMTENYLKIIKKEIESKVSHEEIDYFTEYKNVALDNTIMMQSNFLNSQLKKLKNFHTTKFKNDDEKIEFLKTIITALKDSIELKKDKEYQES